MDIFNDYQLSSAKEKQMGISGPLTSQELDTLTESICKYESLKSGRWEPIARRDLTLKNLGEFLVECRIYKRITQGKMAKYLGMGRTSFQGLEARFYANANLNVIVKVVSFLNVEIELVLNLQPDEDE
jgi:DNA-binding XRE family transcriptional regulator